MKLYSNLFFLIQSQILTLKTDLHCVNMGDIQDKWSAMFIFQKQWNRKNEMAFSHKQETESLSIQRPNSQSHYFSLSHYLLFSAPEINHCNALLYLHAGPTDLNPKLLSWKFSLEHPYQPPVGENIEILGKEIDIIKFFLLFISRIFWQRSYQEYYNMESHKLDRIQRYSTGSGQPWLNTFIYFII